MNVIDLLGLVVCTVACLSLICSSHGLSAFTHNTQHTMMEQSSSSAPVLILHVDINKTLLIQDPVR